MTAPQSPIQTSTAPGRQTWRRCSTALAEAELVLAAESGDESAFEELYRRYSRRIHGFARTIVHDSHEAADVTQVTFVTASQRLGQLRSPEGFRPWLFSVARHEALRRADRRGRSDLVPELEITGDDVTDTAVSATLRRQDVAAVIADAADALAGRDRCVIAHRLRSETDDGASLSDELGISRDHAYTLVHRAGTRLRDAIAAVVIARDPSHCDGLGAKLQGWHGRYTPQVHRRVRHHMAHCDTCCTTSQDRVADLQD